MTTGQRIKAARKAAGMTQKELAQKLNTSVQNVSQYETDKVNPTVKQLRKISTAIGCSLDDLIDVIIVEMPKLRTAVQKINGTAVQKMNDLMEQLNDPGQQEAVHQVEQLTKIPEYKK